jgi:hypothetical protein
MAAYRAAFKFSRVVVFESLHEDPQTGTWLVDTVLLPLSTQHGVPVQYHAVNTSADLFATLQKKPKQSKLATHRSSTSRPTAPRTGYNS